LVGRDIFARGGRGGEVNLRLLVEGRRKLMATPHRKEGMKERKLVPKAEIE
jgi:hypothetical protein